MNRGRMPSLYNVYLNGQLIAARITKQEIYKLVGCSKSTLRNHINKNTPIRTKKGIFIVEEIETELDGDIDIKKNWQTFEQEWDEARTDALRALRSPEAVKRFRASRGVN